MTLEAVERKAGLQKVLVVDDQADVREALRLLLKGAGYAIETADSPNDALAAAAYRDHDLIVMDMNYTWDTTSGEEGLRLLDRLRSQRRDVPIIAMTGWSTIELAVEAMHHGACDFVPKPWENRHFLSVVKKHLNTEPERARPMDVELAIARKVQRKLLPQPHFNAYGLSCECACLPAGEISGDLYDFFEIDSESMAFLLGDVCGKGIGAALLMANLQATIRGQRELARYPSKLMERVNYLFFESTRPEHYASMFYGVYEASTRSIRYANCGHPPPVLVRASGEYELLEPSATVLGAFKERGFEERRVAMRPGDRMVLFSDGFWEARMDDGGEDWALQAILARAGSGSRGLAGALGSMAAEGEQADDVTVMDIFVL
ncbi:MAG: fused response regulator/phosphatase [Acidobacteriaceae bacterium]|nr:fused response regulator/phosphatase [Acidobacteriaceae bacterium]